MAYQQRTITGSCADDSADLISGILMELSNKIEYSAMGIMIHVIRAYYIGTGG